MPKEWVIVLRSVMAITLVCLSFLSQATINFWSKRTHPSQFSNLGIIVAYLAGRALAILIFHFVLAKADFSAHKRGACRSGTGAQ